MVIKKRAAKNVSKKRIKIPKQCAAEESVFAVEEFSSDGLDFSDAQEVVSSLKADCKLYADVRTLAATVLVQKPVDVKRLKVLSTMLDGNLALHEELAELLRNDTVDVHRSFKLLQCIEDVCDDDSSLVVANVTDEKIDEAFCAAWSAFSVALQSTTLSSEFREQVVLHLENCVLSRMQSKAVMFADFVMDSFKQSCPSTSVTALRPLYRLIAHCNVDYPSFYMSLYALASQLNDLSTAHFAALLNELSLFLASTHMTAAIVASFIRRLSQTALLAPRLRCLPLIQLITNLLIRYDDVNIQMKLPGAGADDCYDSLEKDPAKAKALGSGLVELRALQMHFDSEVCDAARAALRKRLPAVEARLEVSAGYAAPFIVAPDMAEGVEMRKERIPVPVL